LIYTFKCSEKQEQKPIILKNLTTVAKLLFLLSVAENSFAQIPRCVSRVAG